jgi:hypothetical protein
MDLKISTSSIARPSKIYPILDFWFENIPSGKTNDIEPRLYKFLLRLVYASKLLTKK